MIYILTLVYSLNKILYCKMDTNFKFNYMIDDNNMVNILHNEVFGAKNGFITTMFTLLIAILFLNILICLTGLFYVATWTIKYIKENLSFDIFIAIIISSVLTISFMNIYLTLHEADVLFNKLNEELRQKKEIIYHNIKEDEQDDQLLEGEQLLQDEQDDQLLEGEQLLQDEQDDQLLEGEQLLQDENGEYILYNKT